MKKRGLILTAAAMAVVLTAATAFAAGNNWKSGYKASIERMEDLIDNMDDAIGTDAKTAVQEQIDALIKQCPELKDFDMDYTKMTEAELEAVEDKLDAFEDAYKEAAKGNKPNNEKVPAETVKPILPEGTDAATMKKAVERLENLIDDMDDAITANAKAAVQTQIDALIEQYPALKAFDMDYTKMTKAELEAIEDKLDVLEDAYKEAAKGNKPNNGKVPAETIKPALPNGTDAATMKKVVERLEDLIDDMDDAITANAKAAVQEQIDELIEQYPALKAFDMDYTKMTEAELEAIENRLDALENGYYIHHDNGRHNGHHDDDHHEYFPRRGMACGKADWKSNELAEQLRVLAIELRDAETDEEREAIKAEIKALVSSGTVRNKTAVAEGSEVPVDGYEVVTEFEEVGQIMED